MSAPPNQPAPSGSITGTGAGADGEGVPRLQRRSWAATVYDYRRCRRARRDAQRPAVAQIAERIATETANAHQEGSAERDREGVAGQFVDVSRLPCGWHWPTRDLDRRQPHPKPRKRC